MVGMDDLVSTTCVEHSNERANELRSSARTEQIEVRFGPASPAVATG